MPHVGIWALPLLWILLFTGLAAIGFLCRATWARRSIYGVFDLFWTGFAVLCVLVQIAHLFVALRSPITAVLILGGGIAAAAIAIRRSRLSIRAWRAPLLAMLPFVLWAALVSSREPPQWDFGLYHLQAIRWAEQYRHVPGLANLYAPLGQVSAFLFMSAALDIGGALQPYHIAGALLVLVVAAEGCTALVEASRRIDAETVFAAIGLPFATVFIVSWLPSASPDVAVAMIGFSAATRLTAILFAPVAARPSALLVVALAAVGITVKASAAPYFALIAVTAVLIAVHDGGWQSLTQLATAAGLFAFIVGTWTMQNVVVSGYPLFPLLWPAAKVPWLVPPDIVRHWTSATYWHTRGVDGVSSNRPWVGTWVRDILWRTGKFQVIFPLIFGVFALVGG